MSRISRYILTQLLVTFGITLAGTTFVLIFGLVVKEIIRFGLGLEAIARLLPYFTPLALRFAVPASILMATCSVFGRMSAENEFVAAKSLGVSPRSIVYPAFALAIAMSMSMVWMNEIALTWGMTGIRTVIFESVEEVVFRKLKTERSFRNKHFSINVKDVVGRKLVEPRVHIYGRQPIVVEAREAELQSDLKAEQLRILLTDYSAETGSVHTANSGTYGYMVPLSQATMKDRSQPRLSQLGWSQISDAAIKQRGVIRGMKQQLAARAAFQMVLGEFPELHASTKHADNQTWNALHNKYEESNQRLNQLQLEPWRRMAEGFSCFFIVLVEHRWLSKENDKLLHYVCNVLLSRVVHLVSGHDVGGRPRESRRVSGVHRLDRKPHNARGELVLNEKSGAVLTSDPVRRWHAADEQYRQTSNTDYSSSKRFNSIPARCG